LLAKPSEVFELQPGDFVMPQITVKNATQWPWKAGVFVGLDESVDLKTMPIEPV